jgi:lipopolysaccharide transport system ATP-binding protein
MSKSIIVEKVSKKFRIHHKMERESQEVGLLGKLLGRGRREKDLSDEDFWALRDISFEVNQGERLAIVGRNGAGKSTLLKILSRVMSPTDGKILIRGRLSSLLEVGTGFHPDLTGRENVYLNGALLGMSRSEVRQKFDAIVDFAEVERFLDVPVKRYSSGMYVRLAFSVSAFLEPDIVVLDEVLSVGDARFQQKSYVKMRELASQGRTVLFVSHSMSAVKDLCESAILIENGRIKEKTKVDDAIGDYMRHAMHIHGANMPLETEQVDLLALHVTQSGRQNPNYNFEGDEPVDVELIYHVKENLQHFRIGFYVKTVFGDILIRSLLADRNPEMENARPGTYRLQAQIPADFLVAGDYVLEVHGSQFGVQDFFSSNALQPFRIARPKLFNIQHEREQAFGHIYLDPGWSLEQISG